MRVLLQCIYHIKIYQYSWDVRSLSTLTEILIFPRLSRKQWPFQVCLTSLKGIQGAIWVTFEHLISKCSICWTQCSTFYWLFSGDTKLTTMISISNEDIKLRFIVIIIGNILWFGKFQIIFLITIVLGIRIRNWFFIISVVVYNSDIIN